MWLCIGPDVRVAQLTVRSLAGVTMVIFDAHRDC